MNTNNKGRRSEKKTEAWLQERGFIVETTVRSSYRGSNDFFNLFDHIAVSGKNTVQIGEWSIFSHATIYVQTKSNRKPPKDYIEKIRQFPALHKFIFIWKDRQKEPTILTVQ